MTIDYDTMHAYVAPVATSLYRQYRGVDVEDIRQELFDWFLRNPGKAREYVEHDDPRQGGRLIGTALMHRGRRFCLREQAAATGYRFEDLAFYSVEQLDKELLPCLFNPEDWASPPKLERGEIAGRQDPAHGGNWVASLADVADAFAKLDAEDRMLIRLRYEEDMPQTRIAKRLATTDQWVSDALARARARMVHLLGGERPIYAEDEIRVGSRRALSNAAAQAATRHQWEGE